MYLIVVFDWSLFDHQCELFMNGMPFTSSTHIRSLYSILVVRLSRSSCLCLCIPGLGDAPIGDAPGDYPTGIPALDEVPRHGRLLGYLLRRSPSFLRRCRPDQCPPSTYHPIALQWSSWPKELHSKNKKQKQNKTKQKTKVHTNTHKYTYYKRVQNNRSTTIYKYDVES